MLVNKTELKETNVLSDIICDICGNSCKIGDWDSDMDFEYMVLEANWGFLSKKDFQTWTAHVCEKCVDEKLSFIKFCKTHFYKNE